MLFSIESKLGAQYRYFLNRYTSPTKKNRMAFVTVGERGKKKDAKNGRDFPLSSSPFKKDFLASIISWENGGRVGRRKNGLAGKMSCVGVALVGVCWWVALGSGGADEREKIGGCENAGFALVGVGKSQYWPPMQHSKTDFSTSI